MCLLIVLFMNYFVLKIIIFSQIYEIHIDLIKTKLRMLVLKARNTVGSVVRLNLSMRFEYITFLKIAL